MKSEIFVLGSLFILLLGGIGAVVGISYAVEASFRCQETQPFAKTDGSLSATYFVVVDDVLVDEGEGQEISLRLVEPQPSGVVRYQPSRVWLRLDVPLNSPEAAELRRSHGRRAMVEVTFGKEAP